MTNITPTDPEFLEQDEWRRERSGSSETRVEKCMETKFMPFSEWQLERQVEAERQKIISEQRAKNLAAGLSDASTQELIAALDKDTLSSSEAERKQVNASAWDKFQKQNRIREQKFMEEYKEATKDAVPVESTKPQYSCTVIGDNGVYNSIQEWQEKDISAWKAQLSVEEKCAIYEEALRKIMSITKVESPTDRSAESFFFVAAGMCQQAIKALKKAGVI